MSIKNFFWDLFPFFYQKFDSHKDGDGKGLLERFVKLHGQEIDEEVMKYLDEDSEDYFLKNVDPETAEEKFIYILAEILGNPPIILDDLEYRKLLKYIISIYKVKGSKLAYQIFFGLLGFDIILEEIEPTPYVNQNLYDVGHNYDDLHRYDTDVVLGGKGFCSNYTLTLTPHDLGKVLPPDFEQKVNHLIKFIEPINAKINPIFPDDMEPEQTGNYQIKQRLFLAMEAEKDFYYISIFYDYDGTTSPGDDLITFDREDIKFDHTDIKWSHVKR